MTNYMSLQNIADGKLEELFQYELKKVLANISDPNTSKTAKRAINLKIEIKPDKDAFWAEVECNSTCKLSPVKSATGFAQIMNSDDEDNITISPLDRDEKKAEENEMAKLRQINEK